MDIIIIFTCTFSSQQEQMMVKVHEGVKHLLYFGIADKLLHVSLCSVLSPFTVIKRILEKPCIPLK